MGVDEMGVDQKESRRSGNKSYLIIKYCLLATGEILSS